MLEVNVSNGSEEHQAFKVESKAGEWFLDGSKFDGDVVQISDNAYHLIWNNVSYTIEVVEADRAGKAFKLLINGRLYATVARDEIDLLLEGMGLNQASANKLNYVKAPMPGLIQSVMVQEGDEVKRGDSLLVLVAMKMENVIKAGGNGVVKSMKVEPGHIVEKNQVLLEFQ
jgi:acetyl/propionyl-CoA carboxylase alpha subunit